MGSKGAEESHTKGCGEHIFQRDFMVVRGVMDSQNGLCA